MALVRTVVAWLAWIMFVCCSDLAPAKLHGLMRPSRSGWMLICLLTAAIACGRSSESRRVADQFMDLYYVHARVADALGLTTGAARTRLNDELTAIKGVKPDTGADQPRVTLHLVSENVASPTQATYVYDVDPETSGIGPLVATVGLSRQDSTWRVVTLDEK